MNNFYTAQEVADILKIKKTTVYDLIKKKTIPATKVGKQIRIRKADFDDYLSHYTENTVEKKMEIDEESVTSKSYVTRINERQPIEIDAVKDTSDSIYMSRDYLHNNTGLILAGDDEIISAFYSYYRFHENALPVIKQWGNLYDSLYSLYYGKIHGALIPIIEKDEAELYKSMLPGMNIISLPIARLDYGLYVHRNWAQKIEKLEDLVSSGCRFAISERGNMNRIFFDNQAKSCHIDKTQIIFTDKECISTIQAAMMIQNGNADATIGGSEIQNQFPDLVFIPLQKVCLKLIYNQEYDSLPAFSAIEEVLSSSPFQRRMVGLGAYETTNLCSKQIY